MQLFKTLVSTPLMWVWYCLFVAVILLHGAQKEKRFRNGWYALTLGFLLLTLLSVSPVSDPLALGLIQRYPPASLEALKNIDIITVLGGGGEDGIPSEATERRIVGGIEMFRKSNAKFLAVQGAADFEGEATDGEIMKRIAIERGIPEGKILLDTRSKTTAEHPAQLKELLPPGASRIGIVTSAIHMPRAMQVFQKYFVYTDKEFTALPVEIPDQRIHYRIVDGVPSVGALSNSSAALHEWIGLLWYRILR